MTLTPLILQPIQIKLVVLIRPEANLPVIAALNQVKWNVGQDHTWATWHGATPEYLNTKSIAETVVCPLFLFMTQTRDAARAHVQKYGHPKKVK